MDPSSSTSSSSQIFPREFFRVLVFVIALILVDRALGAALQAGRDGIDPAINPVGLSESVLRNLDSKIFVFGSSRANHHVVPKILEETFGVKVFNAGRDGQSVAYARMLESIILQEGSAPELILMQVSEEDIFDYRISKAASMATYYDEYPVVRNLLRTSDAWAPIRLKSIAFRYNSQIFFTLSGLFREPDPGWDGFIPLRGSLTNRAIRYAERDTVRNWLVPDASVINPRSDELLREFIQVARLEGIEVFLFIGPRFRGSNTLHEQEILAREYFRSLADEEDAVFRSLDENDLPILKEARWYSDSAHLNAQGAALFTKLFAEQIERVRH
jgi:hypothetical protein